MELARQRGFKVTEKALIRHDLFICEECFATGTAAEVIAITKIAGCWVGDGQPGPITRQLKDDFVAYRRST